MGRGAEISAYAGVLAAALILGAAGGGANGAAAAGVAAFVVLTYVAYQRDQGRPSGTTLQDAERDWRNARSQATVGAGLPSVVVTYLRLRRARREQAER